MADISYPLANFAPPGPVPRCAGCFSADSAPCADSSTQAEIARLQAENAHLQAENAHLQAVVASVEQEARHWKWRARVYESLFRRAQARAAKREAELQNQIDALKATIRQYEHEARNPSTESYPGSTQRQRQARKRKRGRQPGQKTPARHNFDHLPTADETIELPADKRCCPNCHQPYADFPGTDDGEIIEIDVRAHRRRYHRRRYRPTCNCANLPRIITAPPPPKVIPKSRIGVSIWVELLIGKFAQHQPVHRLLAGFRDHALDLSPATVTDGFRHIATLMQPLYDALARHQRDEHFWQSDETRWMVFIRDENKPDHAWSMFAVRSRDCVVYILEARRTHDVPQGHLPEQGILVVDRATIYKAMRQVKEGGIILAFCWAHQRRDFLRLLVSWKDHAVVTAWASTWLERIGELFAANAERRRVLKDPAAFAEADRRVREQVAEMARQWQAELEQADLHWACRKVLESLQRHWAGLTVFVEHPEVPMDNNASEQCERVPALGRKNYYGSEALWSGQFAAMMFSIFQTLQMWGLSFHLWLAAYLRACAESGGHIPANAESYLPWNLSAEQRSAWSVPGSKGSAAASPDTS